MLRVTQKEVQTCKVCNHTWEVRRVYLGYVYCEQCGTKQKLEKHIEDEYTVCIQSLDKEYIQRKLEEALSKLLGERNGITK